MTENDEEYNEFDGGVEETKGADSGPDASEEEDEEEEEEEGEINLDDDGIIEDPVNVEDDDLNVEDEDIVKNGDDDEEGSKNNYKVPYESGDESEYSSDESESESESEEYNYAKIDNEKKIQYIKENHTQELTKTYEEIIVLTQINRTKLTDDTSADEGDANISESDIVINDSNHKTVPILTKYEKTRILGLRVSQLNEGAPRYIKSNTIIDNNIIAEKELRHKKLPFIISRPLPNGKKEYWKLQDLEII
jgi:DNA-directed RNA polymerase I, II, and III subunit RPABC2